MKHRQVPCSNPLPTRSAFPPALRAPWLPVPGSARLWFLWPDAALQSKRCRNRCGCLGGCRFFGGTASGLDFFRLEELTPSSSSAFSSASAESDMCYGQSLLQPGEWIVTKESPRVADGKAACRLVARADPLYPVPS